MIMNAAAGRPAPSFTAVNFIESVLDAQTKELQRFLDVVSPLEGLAIATGNTYTSLDAYWSKTLNLGSRTTGANHYKFNALPALVIPKKLTANQKGEATLDFDIHFESVDGITSPITFSTGVSLPTVQVADQKWTLGKGSVNGTEIDGLQSLEYDFGLSVQKDYGSGLYWPEHIFIDEQKPKLTIKALDQQLFTTIGVTGLAQGATPSDFYLRKFSKMGVRVADATLQHIRIRVNASQGYWYITKGGGSNNKQGEIEVCCLPIEGAATSIITITTGVAVA